MERRPADWSQAFDDPIPLPGREPLTTLRQACEYIAALPAKDQHQVHWQTAVPMLLMAAERHGPLMFARIAVLRLAGRQARPSRAASALRRSGSSGNPAGKSSRPPAFGERPPPGGRTMGQVPIVNRYWIGPRR